VRIKVREGTADHGQRSLCETCRWSTVIRGRRLDEEIIECSQLSDHRRVPFAVATCSDFVERVQPGLKEMQEIAWILRTDPHRKQMGFVRSSRLPDEERYALKED
jgi:hypothetical protein